MGVAEAPVDGLGTLQATPPKSPGLEDCSLKIAEFPRQTSRGTDGGLVPFAPRPGRVPARAPWHQEPFEAAQSLGPDSHLQTAQMVSFCFTLHPGSLPPWPPHRPAHTAEEGAGTGALAGCTAMTCVLRVPRCPPPHAGSAGGLLGPAWGLHLTGHSAGRPAPQCDRERSWFLLFCLFLRAFWFAFWFAFCFSWLRYLGREVAKLHGAFEQIRNGRPL